MKKALFDIIWAKKVPIDSHKHSLSDRIFFDIHHAKFKPSLDQITGKDIDKTQIIVNIVKNNNNPNYDLKLSKDVLLGTETQKDNFLSLCNSSKVEIQSLNWPEYRPYGNWLEDNRELLEMSTVRK